MDKFGDNVLEFSNESLKLTSNYAKDIESKIRNFAVNLRPEYIKMLVFDVENDVRFFALKEATKRRSQRVEEVDVREALKRFGKPEEFIRSHIRKAENCVDSQRITLGTLEAIREKLEQAETPMVLDAGCRWGRVSKKLDFCARGLQIVGVDLDKLSLQYGKTVNRTAIFLCSDIQALPFKDEVFNIILCSGVIHEVKNMNGRRKAAKELSRVLSIKGSLYIVDAFAKLRIISAITFVFQHVVHAVEWIPKKEAIEKLLRENGLEVTTIKGGSSCLRGAIAPYTLVATRT
jgi:ubiquinone/menaquinone biosynthesis C-methylase UbiE